MQGKGNNRAIIEKNWINILPNDVEVHLLAKKVVDPITALPH